MLMDDFGCLWMIMDDLGTGDGEFGIGSCISRLIV